MTELRTTLTPRVVMKVMSTEITIAVLSYCWPSVAILKKLASKIESLPQKHAD